MKDYGLPHKLTEAQKRKLAYKAGTIRPMHMNYVGAPDHKRGLKPRGTCPPALSEDGSIIVGVQPRAVVLGPPRIALIRCNHSIDSTKAVPSRSDHQNAGCY